MFSVYSMVTTTLHVAAVRLATQLPLKETPVQEQDHEERNSTNGRPLSQHGLQIDIACCFTVLGRL
jgi:hypothetical protein